MFQSPIIIRPVHHRTACFFSLHHSLCTRSHLGRTLVGWLMPCSTTPPISPCWSCRRPACVSFVWLCGATPGTWPHCLWCAQPPARWLMTRSCGRRSCCAGMAALHCQRRLQLAEQQVRRLLRHCQMSRCMFSRQQLRCLQCTKGLLVRQAAGCLLVL